MTMSIGQLVGEIDLDISGALKSLDRIGGQMASEGRSWSKVIGDSAERAAKAGEDGLQRLMDSLPKNMRGTIHETSAEFRALGPSIRAAILEAEATAADALTDSVLPAAASGTGRDTAEAMGDGALAATPSVMGRIQKKWKAGLALIAASAGAAFSVSLVNSMDLEASRDRVSAALDLSTKDAERAGQVSSQLYTKAWGSSADEVDAAVEAVMSSIKGMRKASEDELSRTTQAALTLASTFQVDVVRASQVAGNMLANGMAKDGVSAMDLLAKALSKVPVQLREDVMDAADEYGQFFNSLGIKGPAAMALLTNSASKGMYGIDKMGDAIKEFTIRATDGSTASTDALKDIGLNAGKVERDLLAGGASANRAFNSVVSGLLKIKDPAARSQAALALFGTPLEDLGTKDIPKFLRSLQSGSKGMKGWQGATERMGKTLGDNAKSNLTSFTRQVQTGFVNLIGGKVLPKVTAWSSALSTNLGPTLDAIGSTIGSTTKFLSEHKAVAITLAAVIGTLTAVTAAHAAVMAVSAAGGMAAWLRSTMLISAATKVWAATQWALNLAMTANPLGLAIAAIVALVAAVVIAWKKSDTFRAVVIGAWEAIKTATVVVFGAVKAAVVKAFDFLKNVFLNFTGPGLIIKHWNKIKAATSAVWSAIKRVVSSQVNMVKAGIAGLASIPGRVAGWFGAAKEGASRKLAALVSFVKGIPKKVLSALGNLGSLLRDAGKKVLQGFIDGIGDKIGDLKGKLKSITGKLTSWKGPPSTDKKILRNNGRLIMRGLIDGIRDGEGNLRKLLRDVTKKLGKKDMARVEKAVQAEYRRGLALAKKRTEVAKALEAATAAVSEAVKLRDDFYDSVNDSALAFGSVTDAGEGATNGKGVVKAMQARLAAIKKFRENMAALLEKGLDDASYKRMIEEGVERAGGLAEALVKDDASVKAIADLQGQIAAAAGGLASDSSKHLYQAGVDSAKALESGLKSQSKQLEKLAQSIGENLAKALSKALGTTVNAAGKGLSGAAKPQGKGPAKNSPKNNKGKNKNKPKNRTSSRQGPLIGTVVQQPGQSTTVLAEQLWLLGRRG